MLLDGNYYLNVSRHHVSAPEGAPSLQSAASLYAYLNLPTLESSKFYHELVLHLLKIQ